MGDEIDCDVPPRYTLDYIITLSDGELTNNGTVSEQTYNCISVIKIYIFN